MNKHILFTEKKEILPIFTFLMDLKRNPKVNDICLFINKISDLEIETRIVAVKLTPDSNYYEVTIKRI
jgi:hypothetical protein